MRKFFVLLKKELKELLTLQLFIPIIFMVILFYFLGDILKDESKKNVATKFLLIDNDNTKTSHNIYKKLSKKLDIKFFKKGKFSIDTIDDNISVIVTIPKEFEKKVNEFNDPNISIHTIIKNFSIKSTKNIRSTKLLISIINNFLSSHYLKNMSSILPVNDPLKIKEPLKTENFVVINNKTEKVDPFSVISFITSQTLAIPIILFMVIIFATQMISIAIATEKENKTLETLLSTPIKRSYIVASKICAASIVSFIAVIFYMIGFKNYMSGITGADSLSIKASTQLTDSIAKLGLILQFNDYIIIAIVVFLGILCALIVSVILASFAENIKAIGALMMPIILLNMIPYLLCIFLDISSLSSNLKYIIYLNPFSYPFLVTSNIFLNKYSLIFYGIAYQTIFFISFVFIAAKLFSSDLIVTGKLNWFKKK